MKTVIILAIGCNLPPWDKMHLTANQTWNADKVEGVDVVHYFGQPVKPNTKDEIYFDIPESYQNLGTKTLMAMEWALANKEFDYLVRVNSSTYVDKKKLIEAVQEMADADLFGGLGVDSNNQNPPWMWGPAWVFSHDVIQKLVENKHLLDRTKMEDVGISYMINALGVPYSKIKLCTIDKLDGDKWRAMCYGSESFIFTDWQDLEKANDHYFFRVKQDHDRTMDAFIMQQLKRYL